jgi:hypothetical protein
MTMAKSVAKTVFGWRSRQPHRRAGYILLNQQPWPLWLFEMLCRIEQRIRGKVW